MSRRITLQDIEFGGKTIPKGMFVLAGLASANRDPSKWGPTADDLDIRRTGTAQHLSFGSGAHYCLGSSLARLEAQVAIGTFARRFPDGADRRRARMERPHQPARPRTPPRRRRLIPPSARSCIGARHRCMTLRCASMGGMVSLGKQQGRRRGHRWQDQGQGRLQGTTDPSPRHPLRRAARRWSSLEGTGARRAVAGHEEVHVVRPGWVPARAGHERVLRRRHRRHRPWSCPGEVARLWR